jgi:hypothetical protein
MTGNSFLVSTAPSFINLEHVRAVCTSYKPFIEYHSFIYHLHAWITIFFTGFTAMMTTCQHLATLFIARNSFNILVTEHGFEIVTATSSFVNL